MVSQKIVGRELKVDFMKTHYKSMFPEMYSGPWGYLIVNI